MALMCAFPPQVYQQSDSQKLEYCRVWEQPSRYTGKRFEIDVWRLLTQLGIPAFPALAALVVVREK